MAARNLSQSLLRHLTTRETHLRSPPSIPLYLNRHRHLSSKPPLIEINLVTSPSFQSDGGSEGEEDEGFVIRKVEEILHHMMLQKSIPDWLPFRPGSSFWVPPMVSVRDLVNKSADEKLSHDEMLSVEACRGWLSSSYFVNDTRGINMDVDGQQVNMEEDLPEEGGGKVIVQVLTGPTDAEEEEEGRLDAKVDPEEGDGVQQKVLMQKDEVEGQVEVLVLTVPSLEDEER